MPAVPEWLVPLLNQFPIAGVVFGMALVVINLLLKKHREELARERDHLNAANARGASDLERAERRQQLALHERTAFYTRQLAQHRRRIRELERQLDRRADT